MGQTVTSIVKALIIAGAILLAGRCADNITERIWPSQLPQNTTDTVMVVTHTRDTITIEKPVVSVIRDTVYQVMENDSTIKVEDHYRADDIDLMVRFKAMCSNNKPSVFDLTYDYKLTQTVIYDTTVINNTVTNTDYIRPPSNHLSIGLGAMIPGPYYKLDINHHKGWYYYGGSVGYFNGSPMIGVNLGININLK